MAATIPRTTLTVNLQSFSSAHRPSREEFRSKDCAGRLSVRERCIEAGTKVFWKGHASRPPILANPGRSLWNRLDLVKWTQVPEDEHRFNRRALRRQATIALRTYRRHTVLPANHAFVPTSARCHVLLLVCLEKRAVVLVSL